MHQYVKNNASYLHAALLAIIESACVRTIEPLQQISCHDEHFHFHFLSYGTSVHNRFQPFTFTCTNSYVGAPKIVGFGLLLLSYIEHHKEVSRTDLPVHHDEEPPQ